MGETMEMARTDLDAPARRELAAALARIERDRGLVVRLADMLGGTVNMVGRFGLQRFGMADFAQEKVGEVARAALSRAYDLAILGLDRSPSSRTRLARAAVIGSGAFSGFIGLAGFLPDATFTTLAIMREIARIAAAEGEDLSGEEARRACLEVFALRSEAGETETDYFAARFAMQGGPVARLIAEAGSRFGVVLGEKFSLQAVPIAGAVAGAALNAAFLDHYRNLAKAHFVIRRLERTYGRDVVRSAGEMLKNHGRDAPFNAA